MSKVVHHLINQILDKDGLTPMMIIFADRNDDSKMLLAGEIVREDFAKCLAKAAVFAEIGRPGTEEEVSQIMSAVKTAVSKED